MSKTTTAPKAPDDTTPKPPENPTAQGPPDPPKAKRVEPVPPPGFKPPGAVRTPGHGARQPLVSLYGIDHLRDVLKLSAEVPVDRVCEDAANKIEALGSNVKPIPWSDKD